jgi:hypothetical protein
MSTRPPNRRQFLVAFRRQDNAGQEWQSIERVFDNYADAARYRDKFNNGRDGAAPFLEAREVDRAVETAAPPPESNTDLGKPSLRAPLPR